MMKRRFLIGLVLLLVSLVSFSQNNGYVVSQNNGFIVKQYYPALTESATSVTRGESGSEHLGWIQLLLDIDDNYDPDIRFRHYVYEHIEHHLGVERGEYELPYHFVYGHFGKSTSDFDSAGWVRYFNFYNS